MSEEEQYLLKYGITIDFICSFATIPKFLWHLKIKKFPLYYQINQKVIEKRDKAKSKQEKKTSPSQVYEMLKQLAKGGNEQEKAKVVDRIQKRRALEWVKVRDIAVLRLQNSSLKSKYITAEEFASFATEEEVMNLINQK